MNYHNSYLDNDNNSAHNSYCGYRRLEPQIENNQLYIGSISNTYTEEALKNMIAEFGSYEFVQLRNKGDVKFAFITYKSVDEAKQRLASMKNNIYGFKVRFAYKKQERNNLNKDQTSNPPSPSPTEQSTESDNIPDYAEYQVDPAIIKSYCKTYDAKLIHKDLKKTSPKNLPDNPFYKKTLPTKIIFENGEVIENPTKEDIASVGARKATFEVDKSDMKKTHNSEFRTTKQADVDYGNGRNNLNNVNKSSSKYSNQSPPKSRVPGFTNRNQPKVIKEKGIVTVTENDKMYVQINQQLIEDFMAQLNSKLLEEAENITVHSLYACLFNTDGEDLWYRARVTNTNPLKVFYIDYGNSEIIDKSMIKRLPCGLDCPDQVVCVKNDGTYNLDDTVEIEKEEGGDCWYVSKYAPWNCKDSPNKSFDNLGFQSQNTNLPEWNIKETGCRQSDDNRSLRSTESKENENKETGFQKFNNYRSRNSELIENGKETGGRKYNDCRSRDNELRENENENRETRYRKSNDYRSGNNELNENEYQKFNKHSPKQQLINRVKNQESKKSGYETDGKTEVNRNYGHSSSVSDSNITKKFNDRNQYNSKNLSDKRKYSANSNEEIPESAKNSGDEIITSEALLVGITDSELYVVIDTKNMNIMKKWFEMCHKHFRPLRNATMDTVCGLYADGKWCRCRIIHEVPLAVKLMDYGGIKEVDLSDLREISEKKIAAINELAIKINASNVHNYKVNSIVKIERLAGEDCWYLSEFAPWNKKKEEESNLGNITFGDWVKVTSCTQNGGFYIKGTSEEITEQYDNMMQSIAFECICDTHVTTVQDLRKGLIVAVRVQDDTNYHRAEILTIGEQSCFVLLVDTGDLTEEIIEDIKLLPENIQEIPYFAVKVNLKNVPKLPLTEEADCFINNCIRRETKFKLISVDINTVDLMGSDNQCLSNLLPQLNARDWELKLDNEDSEPTVSEIKFTEWPIDVVIEVVVSIVNKDNVIMAGRVDVFYELESLDNLIAAYCQQNTHSFVPQQNELCLAKNSSDGKFYRAYCVEKARSQPFFVCFLDSGHLKKMPHTDIRKMPREFLRFPVQICTGIVKNNFDVSSLERKRIKCKVLEMVEPGVYEIEIKNVVRS